MSAMWPSWQPQIHGSGVALFDFDGDGRLDIYLLNFGGPDSHSINRLYKNMPDGTFKDVTAGSGLGIAGYNMGVASATSTTTAGPTCWSRSTAASGCSSTTATARSRT